MSIRNIRRSVLIVAGAGAVAVGGLVAGRLAAGVLPGEGAHAPFGPGRFARIARALDLTDDQKAQIKSVLKSRSAEIQGQIKAGVEARRALHEAILADPIDETAIRARAADLSRVEANGAVLFAHVRAEILPVLNADQKQKLAQWRGRMRGRADRAARAFESFVNEPER